MVNVATDPPGTAAAPGGPFGLRLRGEVEGVERSFPISPGEGLVGGARDAAVHLPVRGVSRRHARLELAGESTLWVTDLESKNGTFVDGRPVARAQARAGQQLRFGPVALELEAVPVDDTCLGLDLGPPAQAPEPAGSLPDAETSLLGQAETDLAAALLDRALAALAGPEPDLERYLATLVDGWGLAGAAVLEAGSPQGSRRGPWAVVASAGSLGEMPRPGEDLRQPSPPDRPRVHRSVDSRGLASTWVEGGPPGSGLALVLWRGERRREPAPWLPAFWRLAVMARSHPGLEVPAGAATGAGGPAELDFPPGIVAGVAPSMRRLYRQMASLAKSDVPILILGETGVGKEHLARTLHRSSSRRAGPFVAVNCAALPAELLEAELFGIGRGVATGVNPRRGRFLEAAGGTLLLDEIGELAPTLQAKLLRVLQEKEIHPLGLSPIPTDARVIAATNAQLHELVAGGSFRRDLFYRLAGDVLEVPPLRRRREDIPRLVGHFLRHAAEVTGHQVRGVTVKALRQLEADAWPGNVRELEHEIRRLVGRAFDGQVIDSAMLGTAALPRAAEDPAPDSEDLDLGRRTESLERQLIQRALRRTAGNQSRAARLLGISRNGLSNRLARLELDAKAFHGD